MDELLKNTNPELIKAAEGLAAFALIHSAILFNRAIYFNLLHLPNPLGWDPGMLLSLIKGWINDMCYPVKMKGQEHYTGPQWDQMAANTAGVYIYWGITYLPGILGK